MGERKRIGSPVRCKYMLKYVSIQIQNLLEGFSVIGKFYSLPFQKCVGVLYLLLVMITAVRRSLQNFLLDRNTKEINPKTFLQQGSL